MPISGVKLVFDRLVADQLAMSAPRDLLSRLQTFAFGLPVFERLSTRQYGDFVLPRHRFWLIRGTEVRRIRRQSWQAWNLCLSYHQKAFRWQTPTVDGTGGVVDRIRAALVASPRGRRIVMSAMAAGVRRRDLNRFQEILFAAEIVNALSVTLDPVYNVESFAERPELWVKRLEEEKQRRSPRSTDSSLTRLSRGESPGGR